MSSNACRHDGCDGPRTWRWWNGRGADGGYCDDHAREQLADEIGHGKPITRREDVADGYVLPAGIQPIDSSLPTIRTKSAFDTYLDTDGNRPRLCRTSWCSNLLGECEIHGEDSAESDS